MTYAKERLIAGRFGQWHLGIEDQNLRCNCRWFLLLTCYSPGWEGLFGFHNPFCLRDPSQTPRPLQDLSDTPYFWNWLVAIKSIRGGYWIDTANMVKKGNYMTTTTIQIILTVRIIKVSSRSIISGPLPSSLSLTPVQPKTLLRGVTPPLDESGLNLSGVTYIEEFKYKH